MHLMYFTEQPMSAYPEEEGRKFGQTALLFSNRFFDPIAGSRLYNERIDEYRLAEEVGFDGIMLNEHHNAPFCMQAKCNIMASILAAITERVKIVLLGNPLPIAENPVRLAEEIAMIDMISKGRLVSGFVRGGGVESLATNNNPAYNRERFEEAHDLIIKSWTEFGPFRWEGNHYQLRVVNPWAMPLQKPHPRIWIPGVTSRETIIWAAQHRYPYIALNVPIDDSRKIWSIYDETAAQCGYKSGSEQRGYLIRCHVAETEEKALANAREFMWMQGEFTGLTAPVWSAPSGYLGPWARRALAEIRGGLRSNRGSGPPFERQLETLSIIAGTPDQVIKKLRALIDATRPSILSLWANDGKVNHEDSMSCIRLMGREVLPAIRDYGRELGLNSPFELDTPVSLAATPKEDLIAPAPPPAGKPPPIEVASVAMLFRELNHSSCKTYLIACDDTHAAALIDPIREKIDRYLATLAYLGCKLEYIIDTHTHADHRSAAFELSDLTGAPIVMHRRAPQPHVRLHVDEGQRLKVGHLDLHILYTPGHSPDAISLRVNDRVLTGDCLLIHGAGRVDFPGGDAGASYDSITQKLFALPDDTMVFPGHDYRGHHHSTIGDEKRSNPRIAGRSREAYIELMNNLGMPLPDRIQEVLQPNQAAIEDARIQFPALAKLSDVRQLSARDVFARLSASHPPVLLDVREQDEFRGELGHIAGAWQLPLGELSERAVELEPLKDRDIIAICRAGVRSTTAAAILTGLGFERVWNLKGGMLDWNDARLPVER